MESGLEVEWDLGLGSASVFENSGTPRESMLAEALFSASSSYSLSSDAVVWATSEYPPARVSHPAYSSIVEVA